MKRAVSMCTSVGVQGSGILELCSALLSFWFDVLLPQWGKGTLLSAVLHTNVLFQLVQLGWTPCCAWKDSPAAPFVGNPVEWVFQRSSHTSSLPLLLHLSGHFIPEQFCLCLIYLVDLFWGIFSQTKDESGAMNWFVSLLRAGLSGTMQQKWAGLENPWQMVKGLILFVVFSFFLQMCPWLPALKESLRAAAG